MRNFVIMALRNYGYRFLGNKSGCYIFGKPLGYGILSAEVREGKNSVSVMLMVKGTKENGKHPNLKWQRTSHDFLEEYDEQKMYEALVQALADCEADIFSKTPVAMEQNRNVRYDFKENVHIE